MRRLACGIRLNRRANREQPPPLNCSRRPAPLVTTSSRIGTASVSVAPPAMLKRQATRRSVSL
jgi:hypothetical protein